MASTLLFSTFLILSSFTSLALSAPIVKTVPVPSGGPESIIFDLQNNLYTGANDGWIAKYDDAHGKWSEFAYASPTRTKEQCDGTTDMALGNICGRTLGLGFHEKSQTFFLADTYHGLCAVGLEGGLANQLVSEVDGLPLLWLDGLDVDQNTGFVYFTDVSSKYNFSQVNEHLATGDSTGRVIEYNPYTRKSRVLLTGLKGVGGVGSSIDSSYVIITEFTGNKVTKYWLTGPKKDTSELILEVTYPANVKLTPEGHHWIGANIDGVTSGIKIDSNGKILEQLSFHEPYNGAFAQEVHPHHGKFYIGSFQSTFLGIHDPTKSSSSDEL